MKYIESSHPPGIVGIITGGTPRFYAFTDALERTIVPMDTIQSRAQSCNPVSNCNHLLYTMDPKFQWLWMLGDDHDWEPGLLMQLLDRQVDLIVPMLPRRAAKWLPVVYARYEPALDGKPHTRTRTYSWQELNEARLHGDELLPIAACGGAGMLIRRHVWEGVAEAHGMPWFRTGTTGPDSMAEDLDFTWKANKMGFGCYVDTTAFMDHLVPAAMHPRINPETGNIQLCATIYGAVIGLYETFTPVEVA